MSDADEMVTMTHPGSGQTATATRVAFEGAWQARGWVLTDDNPDIEHREGDTAPDGFVPAVVVADEPTGDFTADPVNPRAVRGVGRNG